MCASVDSGVSPAGGWCVFNRGGVVLPTFTSIFQIFVLALDPVCVLVVVLVHLARGVYSCVHVGGLSALCHLSTHALIVFGLVFVLPLHLLKSSFI